MIDTQAIKTSLPIDRVIGRYLDLITTGGRIRAICPFHADHRPSLCIDTSRQAYKCFACQAGGDIFTFVQDIEGLTFPEALSMLASQAGVAVDEQPDGTPKRLLYDVVAEAASRYYEQMNDSVFDYLIGRGLSESTILDYGVGFCRRGCLSGLDPQLAEQAGLLTHRQDGSLTERMLNRVIFPIRDWLGRPIGFGGRIGPTAELQAKTDGRDVPKYLNTPATPLFDKQSALFGIDVARKGTCLDITVVEGYMDVLGLHGRGVDAVGTMGTACTVKHLQLLKRLNRTAILTFDGDRAGRDAAQRAVKVFLQSSLICRVRPITGDPDEHPAITAVPTVDPIDYVADCLLDGCDDAESKSRATREFTAILASIPRDATNDIKVQHALTQFADRVGIPAQSIRRIMTGSVKRDQPARDFVPYDALDFELARLAVSSPESLTDLPDYHVQDAQLDVILQAAMQYIGKGEIPSLDDITRDLSDADRRVAFSIIGPIAEGSGPACVQAVRDRLRDRELDRLRSMLPTGDRAAILSSMQKLLDTTP